MDPTAVMGRRIGAWLIDFVIAIVIFFVSFAIFGDSAETIINLCDVIDGSNICFHANGTTYLAEGSDATAIILLTYGSGLFFAWIVQGATGGTPGKLIVGLRVVDQNTGRLAGYGKCLGRTLMWVVDSFPYIFPLVGLISGVASKGHRRVGDMAASTLVVDKNDVGRPPIVPGLTAPQGASQWSQPPPPGYEVPQASVTAQAQSTDGDGITAPKWDAARNAYIQWNPDGNHWMQYDEATTSWTPIV